MAVLVNGAPTMFCGTATSRPHIANRLCMFWFHHRHKRHTCHHILAWGKLRLVRQQLQQSRALAALSVWAQSGRHYKAQLLHRSLAVWGAERAASLAQSQAAASAWAQQRQRSVLHAWWQYMEAQVCGGMEGRAARAARGIGSSGQHLTWSIWACHLLQECHMAA